MIVNVSMRVRHQNLYVPTGAELINMLDSASLRRGIFTATEEHHYESEVQIRSRLGHIDSRTACCCVSAERTAHLSS
jgi:hypothetical protein